MTILIVRDVRQKRKHVQKKSLKIPHKKNQTVRLKSKLKYGNISFNVTIMIFVLLKK